MKYCIFSAQYRPTVGGVENYTYYLTDRMVRGGDSAIVVTSALPSTSARETQPNGVEVFRLPSHFSGGRLPFVKTGAETRTLMAEVAALKPERVILQTRLYTLSLLGARFAKEQGLPSILIEHGHAYTTSGNPLVNAGLAAYTSGLRKKIFALCPEVYAVSQSAAGWLAAHGTNPRGLLYNSISVDAIRDAGGGRDFRAEAGVPANGYIVAYTGRLIPQKGVPELAQAVAMYNERHASPLTLLLAGEGELEESLAGNRDPRIRCLGRLAFPEVVALLKAADIFCLPTDMNEGLPTSLLEAGACGTFAIATDRGGVHEILPRGGTREEARQTGQGPGEACLSGGEYGMLLDDNRPGTLLAALEAALADPAYRKRAAKRLQQRVVEHFSYDALYEKVTQLPWREPQG